MSIRRFEFIAAKGDTEAAFVEVGPRRLRAARRALLPGRSPAAQASLVYVAGLTLGLIAVLFWGVWGEVGAYLEELARPYRLIWGPPAILLLLLGVLRYNTLQGFVSFSEPDCAYLLTAPVRRSGLTRPRLLTMTIVLGCAGALGGVAASFATRGLTAQGGSLHTEALSGLALGIILVATGWQVQRSASVSRWVLRLTIPALAVAVLLAVAMDLGGLTGHMALWSGPWGWAVLAAVSDTTWQGWAGAGLLWACAIAGVAGMVISAGRCSLEGFRDRARTRSRVVAGMYSFDTRSALLATRRPQTLRRLSPSIPVPRRAVLALPWRGLVSLLRSPVRLGWGIVLGGGAALLISTGRGSAGTIWGGALLLYLAASALLEPLRMETDRPGASHLLLPWSFGRVLWYHCLLPSVLLLAAGYMAALGGFAAGRVSAGGLLTFAILWVTVAPTMVLGAALTARRGGRASTDLLLMASGDSTGLSLMPIVLYMFGWSIAAIAVVALGTGPVLQTASPLWAVTAAPGFGVVIWVGRNLLLSSKPKAAGEGAGSLLSRSREKEESVYTER